LKSEFLAKVLYIVAAFLVSRFSLIGIGYPRVRELVSSSSLRSEVVTDTEVLIMD